MAYKQVVALKKCKTCHGSGLVFKGQSIVLIRCEKCGGKGKL